MNFTCMSKMNSTLRYSGRIFSSSGKATPFVVPITFRVWQTMTHRRYEIYFKNY